MLRGKLKKIKSKKGASSIEFVISLMIFLIIFSLGLELIVISYKYMSISNYSNEVVRTLSVQGGVCMKAPPGYQGGNRLYENFDALIEKKNALAKSLGSESSSIAVDIKVNKNNGVEEIVSLDDRREIKIDYLETFEVTVSYTPEYIVLGNFTDGLSGVLKKTRTGMSEYLYDYGSH